ncbi:hypothetical protein Holit_02219 [Hollandina sp. SP2]
MKKIRGDIPFDCMRCFSPNKGFTAAYMPFRRNKIKIGKLCQSNGVRMSVANDLAKPDSEPPVAHTSCYVQLGLNWLEYYK